MEFNIFTKILIWIKILDVYLFFSGLDVAAGQYVYLEKVQCGVDEVDQSQNLESLNQYFK